VRYLKWLLENVTLFSYFYTLGIKMKLFALLFFIQLVGCATAPKDLVKDIDAVPEIQVFRTVEVAAKNLLPEAIVDQGKVSLEFTKNDRLVLKYGKRAPVKVIELKNDGPQFLIFSSVIKSAGWQKDAGVMPKVDFLMNGQLLKSPSVKQIGYDGLCGLYSCLVTTYDLTALPKGNYKLVVTAFVDDPEVPADIRKVEGIDGGAAAAGIYVYTSANRKQYASYFGEIKIEKSNKLPLKDKN
jgi:hypothetical protein